MLNRVRNQRVQCALVLLALLAVQLLMHMNVDNLLLDDWAFYAVLEAGEGVPAWLMNRWETWSSRLLIEGVLCVITHSIWAFRVLDSLIMVLLAWGLCRLANCEERPGMLALSSLLVTSIPFAVLRSTGWMATSLNYYWPLAATAIALIPLADSLWRRETGRGMTAIAVACAVLGANQEQTSAVIAGSYLVLGACLLRDKRVRRAHAAILVIAAVELTLHLTCPGNAVRSAQSVAVVNLRDYGQFSLIDKLSIGLTSTTALLLFTWNPVLLATGALVLCTVPARRRGVLALVLALAPLGFALLMQGAQKISGPAFASNWGSYVLQLGPERIQWAGQMQMMFVIICMLGLMALSLYLSIGHRPLAVSAMFAFAVGFAARMALAFSPTVVESGERTMLPLYGAMMICALLCVRDCKADGSRRWPLLLAFAVCAIIAAMNIAVSFALAA